MKRWRERNYDPAADERDPAAQGPLWVEPLAARRRARYGAPILIVGFVLLAFVVAMFGRFAVLFSSAADTPQPPTPIAWVDITVAPSVAASADAGSAAPADPIASRRPPLSISAQISSVSAFWYRSSASRFTLDLANPTAGRISMDPCPAYRIYLAGTDKSSAVLRRLNCAAIGPVLVPGGVVSLDMEYTPAGSDPTGSQTLVWEWASPDSIQAIATASVFIAP
ncbi:MAG: hypothetical protein ACHQ01_01285 [Candidatus Limnocylindrales bacterium]